MLPTHRKIAGNDVAVVNVELDLLLAERGWVEFDRVDDLTMYDWPPSGPDEEHEITYLVIDLRGAPGAGPRYRMSVVDGDRLSTATEN
jgi:hypothetical protein